MAGIATRDDLTLEQRASLEKVCRRFVAAERLHKQLEPRWNTFYGLSRNWRRGANGFNQARTPKDKDVVIDELRRQFGQELFIPYCFTVIETNVPRILSKAPRYRALANELDPTTEEARRPLEALYERDSLEMRYERKLQETVRSGLRYGLGVQKSYWEKKTRDGKKLVPRALGLGRRVKDTQIVVFEGPQTESVDIYDFFWDPAAYDLESAQYVIHRTWRSFEYIRERVEEGGRLRDQGLEKGWLDLDLEEIKKLSSSTARGEAWSGRWEAAGLTGYQPEGNELYEVWEYHDRDQVITTLGGKAGILAQEDINPFLHGDYPFEIYRPTLIEHEFCGSGEVEPIAHLQWELNTLRGQRRDAATLALNRGYFYERGKINPKEIVVGAGVFNPVNGPPNEVIQPMPFVDLPASGDTEEQAIKSDIELTSAISEAVVGSSAESTATGTQLVQQAAGYRIRQKARNLHTDLLVPETKKRKALYEQHLVAYEQSRSVRVEDPTTPTGFAYLTVTPEMFMADVEVLPVDGSTEPDDPAQKKHDAMELAQSLAPFAEVLKPQELVKYILDQHDIEDTSKWVREGPSPEQASAQIAERLSGAFMDAMREAGVESEEAEQILAEARSSMEGEHREENPEGPAGEPEGESGSERAPAPEPQEGGP